ncbi:MAG: DUF4159 domain-containing protein [Acidobacteriota bacterium]
MRGLRLSLVLLLTAAAVAAAQEWRRGGWGGRGEGFAPPRYMKPDDYDGKFTFCRLQYTRVRPQQRGLGWSTDYPNADQNFSIRLSELTTTAVSMKGREPNHYVVRATDESIFLCPFVIASDPASAGFSPEEAAGLRAYLLKGGLLWADDFWGPWAWEDWLGEIGKVLPPSQYSVQEVPADHPIHRALFEVASIPQVPSFQFWWGSGGQTSEMGSYSEGAHMAAIFDRQGRPMVIMTHNTDIQDAWEREGELPEYFLEFSPKGYAVGLNVVLYGLTH